MLALIAIFGVLAGVQCREYNGDQVYRLEVQTPNQIEYLQNLQNNGADFWTEVRLGNVDVRVELKDKTVWEKEFQNLGINFSVMIEDLAGLIKESKTWFKKGDKSRVGSKHAMDWTSYHPVEDMHDFMDFLVSTYDYVSVSSIGQSYEGNDMRVLSVCKGGCGNKPAIWIDGGIHAREWVSPATVTYMINELLENNSDHPDLTEELDWYIIPNINPDGYNYSYTDRLWRKTRSPNDNGCFGTDANRNWGFHWNEGGSSNDPCDEAYMGKEAFSEVENRNVRDFILERKGQIKFFNTLHSYSQYILLPWGWSFDHPDNYLEMQLLAFEAVLELLIVHGTEYEVGSIPSLLYIASGGSLDWALGEAGIPYSFAMELRDKGKYGFVLPPDQIIPTGEETWAFHLTVARAIIREFGKQI
ncbi:carboxypeptidase B [Eurytemora carolleeae]|uniref:carboxypeptidase B n=1 Tax=Eurytemora carolleeae TaxID=1294199 RepID=UPI000C7890FA|nr:carboxypeptidase B [Eurytemora carolleeae]|eukprot:XP_023330917.1 carboxypeptidase B-like [Eurytemora affinis]